MLVIHADGTFKDEYDDGEVAGHVTGPAVVLGCDWCTPRPYAVRMELSLTAEEMIAALYFSDPDPALAAAADLAADEAVWERVAVVITQDGLGTIRDRADDIRGQEESGAITAPQWLACCRRRVADVTARFAPAQVADCRDAIGHRVIRASELDRKRHV